MYNMLQRLIALFILIVLSPLFLIISILIKIESKGPIIFRQKRVGKNGKHFIIYKFRSMKVDTPNVATVELHNSSNFITKIGKFIRKTSLDELPQLLNILKGDMLFVGPRPVIVEEYELNKLRLEEGIYNLYPGITGWAQINGRDELNIYDKVKYDKEYLENRCFKFDFKILLATILKVVSKDGIVEGEKEKL